MWMHGHDMSASVADNYRAFAQDAHGRSAVYETLANEVAADSEILGFLHGLPPQKRQPNLLFAAARYVLNAVPDPALLRALVSDGGPLAQTMLARRTQTNEPARCATLLPALAQLPEPLALIEVGASAGLTLLFDRYNYDYSGHRVVGDDPVAPTLRCQPRGPVLLPDRVPQIVWRVGLDLNPLDVNNHDDMRWLRCLVWPGEADRDERLTEAIDAARRDPPTVHRGDLLTDLAALVAQAPPDTTVVVYHSAVLAYLTPQQRISFADTVKNLRVVWLSNEGPGVLPNLPAPVHDGAPFVITRDGRTPFAVCDSHGTWVEWLSNPMR